MNIRNCLIFNLFYLSSLNHNNTEKKKKNDFSYIEPQYMKKFSPWMEKKLNFFHFFDRFFVFSCSRIIFSNQMLTNITYILYKCSKYIYNFKK